MGESTQTVIFIFGLIGIGYLCALVGLLKAETGAALAEFTVAVAVPVLLFRTMAEGDFGAAAPWALWAAYFSAIAVSWTLGHLLAVHIFARDARAGVVAGVSASFSNLVLLGIPFIQGLFGAPGFALLSLIVAVHLPVMISASIILFEWFGRDGRVDPARAMRTFLRRLFGNPLIVGIVLGIAWRFSGLSLPATADRIVDAIAGVAGTVALLSMGLSLRAQPLAGNIAPAVAISVVKLFVMPALALGAALLVGLPPLAAKVAVAAAALPTGVNPYLIATRFGTGQALAGNCATIGTVAAAATTAVWLAIAQAVFG